MNTRMILSAASAAALFLTACGGGGSSDPGIEATIKAVTQGTPSHEHEHEGVDGHDAGVKIFRRGDGTKIELQVGLLNLVPIELQPCSTSASLRMQQLMEGLSPMATAYAHGGANGTAPAGAISVAGEETTDLGSVSAAPGQYCGIVVELQTSAVPDTGLTGASISVAPCHYDSAIGLSDEDAEAVTEHHCIEAKVAGPARRVTLPFKTPMTLNAANRAVEVTIAVRYEEWFDKLDFGTLETDADEQAKLADNVAGSLHAITSDEQNVALGFKIQVNGEEAVCGQVYDGLGNGAKRTLRMEGFRFYASDFTLENATSAEPVRLATKPNDTVLQDDEHGIALIGHAQGCDVPAGVRNLALSGAVKKGEYDKVCFTLGVPYVQAHSDPATAPSPLNVTGMDWSWLFGRMFFRFDSLADPDGAAAPFFLHLGSTGCSNGTSPQFGAPPTEECVYPNRSRICLDYGEIAEGHSIIADIAPLVAELDITQNTPDTAPGCMSFPEDPECVTVVPQYGLDYPLNPPALIPRREQTLFHIGE